MGNDTLMEMFIFETAQMVESLEGILLEGEKNGGFDDGHINEIFRVMHTIKGSSAMMGVQNVSKLAHATEDLFFYIRENHAVPDWGHVTDLVLEAADFFKAETAKLSAGQTADGDESGMLSELRSYLELLKSGGEAQSPAEQPKAATAQAPVQAAAAAAAQTDGMKHYTARIFFLPDSKMENIRAFQIVNALTPLCSELTTEPADLLEDCSEQIEKNGVLLRLASAESSEKLRAVISESVFLKSCEFKEVAVPAAPAPAQEESGEEEPAAQSAAEAAAAAAAVVNEQLNKAKQAAVAAAPAASAGVAEPAMKQSFMSVNVDKLDKLMDLVGELITAESMVTRNPELKSLQLEGFDKAASHLRKLTNELQDLVMSVRMIPVSSTFHKMSRIVRDLSRKMGKDAELQIRGEETEVDKSVIDSLSDPLMHIIRNSMDHGLEATAEERVKAGKPAVGIILLEARNAGAEVVITVSDDGRGLNRDRILKKAAAQGLLTKAAADMTDKEVYDLILLPGFSTQEKVTELSGRGVGMDVVKKNIERIGGSVNLMSEPGRGLMTVIKIPLTLSIIDGMLISVGEELYVVPVLSIRESMRPKMADMLTDPDGNEMIMIRGECHPVLRLYDKFGVDNAVTDFEEGILIMAETDDKTICLLADKLLGQQQVVVKPVPAYIARNIGQLEGIGGCTIMGDGSISLILDLHGLIKQ